MLVPSLAASAAFGASLAAAARVHHAPAGAAGKKVSAARAPDAAEPYTLTLHLSSPRVAELDERVTGLASDAGGAWLSADDVKSYLAPASNHTAAVTQWLAAHNVSDARWSPLGDRVSFTSTHADVASKFQAPLALYSLARNVQAWRSDAYTVPDELEDVVESITPLTSFLVPAPRHRIVHRYTDADVTRAVASASKHAQGCSDTFVTLDCIREHYGSAGFTPVPGKNNETDILIIGYGEDEEFSPTDLAAYLKKFRPDQAGYHVSTQTFDTDSATTSDNAGSETMLDLEMAVGIAAPLKVEFLLSGFTGDDMFLKPLENILDADAAAKPKPGVISVSYGPAEADMTKDDARRWYKTALALAAQGTTVVFASGDAGVDQTNENCAKGGIKPPWPTTSSILVVGSTTGTSPEHATNPLTDNQNNIAVWSGAGWSNLNKAPAWQRNISSAYLDALPHNVTKYVNTTGRGITDVSAFGEAIAVVVSNTTQTVAGTSASAPIWAAHLALVNSALRQKGKKNVGFVHPRLYQAGQAQGAVTDIVHGTTCGCPDINLCFPSQKGWDPATGLGVPNFKGMLAFWGAA